MNKCMYCEGHQADVSYPAVEHIKPKEQFPELVVEWENLGLVCTVCNTEKRSYWQESDALRLLNPYVDDPDEHLGFSGAAVYAAAFSTRGKNTIRQLRLNRPDLFFARLRAQQNLDDRLLQWLAERDLELKAVLAQDISDILSRESEFSAALRSHAEWRGFA